MKRNKLQALFLNTKWFEKYGRNTDVILEGKLMKIDDKTFNNYAEILWDKKSDVFEIKYIKNKYSNLYAVLMELGKTIMYKEEFSLKK